MSAFESSSTGLDVILEVRGLSVVFPVTGRPPVKAVNSLSFAIRQGETVALVGESGCGKSVTAFSIMQLLQKPGEISAGEIVFMGSDLNGSGEKNMRTLRGSAISMIFQEPMTSLNPVLKTGFQITEAIMLHRKLPRKEADAAAVELLSMVGIPAAEERYHSYPHQLSGGMKQRAMIAMALACNPKLLIADEPTTALDVTIQAQILTLIDSLKKKTGMSLLLITHNLGIVARHADSTVIMYAGFAVESAPTSAILSTPLHPYTKGLLASLPQSGTPGEHLTAISGTLSPGQSAIPGCPFEPRCPIRIERCKAEMPPLVKVAPEHLAACWKVPPYE